MRVPALIPLHILPTQPGYSDFGPIVGFHGVVTATTVAPYYATGGVNGNTVAACVTQGAGCALDEAFCSTKEGLIDKYACKTAANGFVLTEPLVNGVGTTATPRQPCGDAVTNVACGIGFIYNTAEATTLCAGAACDMAADKGTCCSEKGDTCLGDAEYDADTSACTCKTSA